MKHLLLILFFPVVIGNAQTAPDFTVTDLEGESHSLYSDYLDDGKTVLLEFFNLNLDPCVALAPYFEELYQHWGGGEGEVQFMTLSDLDDDFMLTSCWVELYNLTYPVAGIEGNADEVFDLYLAGQFGPFINLPTYVIVAPDGTMAFDIREDDIEPLILLNEYLETITAAGTVKVKEKPVQPEIYFQSGSLFWNVEDPNAEVMVYSISGQLLAKFDSSQFPVSLNKVPKGFNIWSFNSNEYNFILKFAIE